MERAKRRFGVEYISSDDENENSNVVSSSDETDLGPPINTTHYARDSQFAAKYFFITNVGIFTDIHNLYKIYFWFLIYLFNFRQKEIDTI